MSLHDHSFEPHRNIIPPSSWVHSDRPSKHRFFEVIPHVRIIVSVTYKELTSVDIFPLFSIDGVGNFILFNPLICSRTAPCYNSLPKFGLHRSHLHPLILIVDFCWPSKPRDVESEGKAVLDSGGGGESNRQTELNCIDLVAWIGHTCIGVVCISKITSQRQLVCIICERSVVNWVKGYDLICEGWSENDEES